MARKTNRKSLNQFWELFVQEGLHEKSLAVDDIVNPSLPYPAIVGLDYDSAVTQLKQHLSDKGWKRLNNRFRQFKSRKVGKKTTITLREETLVRLRTIAYQVGMDDYDMLFEYLLDPEEDLEPQKDAINLLPSALSVEESTVVMLKKLQLRVSTRRIIYSAIQQAYVEGWKKGKAHKGKTIQNVILSDSEDYLNKLRSLE